MRFAEVESAGPGEHAAKAALDMAVLDWVAKKLGVPLWRLLGLGRDKVLTTTYSIGIDEVPVMQQKVRDAAEFGVYKIKVGTADDRKIIEGIRAVTAKPLRVDANEGWKTKEEALEMIDWLAGQGVELVEQPLPAGRLEDYAWLKDRVKIPVFADESLILPSDLPRIAPYVHGVNVKLMKCGGIQEAVRLAGLARALGLKLMIGCMIESSLGIIGRGGRGVALRLRRPGREPAHLERSLPGRRDRQRPAGAQRQAGTRGGGGTALGTGRVQPVLPAVMTSFWPTNRMSDARPFSALIFSTVVL